MSIVALDQGTVCLALSISDRPGNEIPKQLGEPTSPSKGIAARPKESGLLLGRSVHGISPSKAWQTSSTTF